MKADEARDLLGVEVRMLGLCKAVLAAQAHLQVG